MNFANTLKDLLQENNLSQARLAEAIGFSQRAVSKWINAQAEPTETAIIACAEYFGITTDDILGRSNDFGNVTIKNTSVALSQNDQALLDSFHSLPKDLQNQLLGYIDFLKLRVEYNNNLSKKR